jgi:hypothetical protein
MSARSQPKTQFNGQEHVSAEEMPVSVRAEYDRIVHETPVLHSGAQLAAKLNAKIILDDTEFDHAGEMSVDARHVYHDMLEALFPPGIAVSVNEAQKTRRNKVLPIAVIVSVLAGAVYLFLRGFG